MGYVLTQRKRKCFGISRSWSCPFTSPSNKYTLCCLQLVFISFTDPEQVHGDVVRPPSNYVVHVTVRSLLLRSLFSAANLCCDLSPHINEVPSAQLDLLLSIIIPRTLLMLVNEEWDRGHTKIWLFQPSLQLHALFPFGRSKIISVRMLYERDDVPCTGGESCYGCHIGEINFYIKSINCSKISFSIYPIKCT